MTLQVEPQSNLRAKRMRVPCAGSVNIREYQPRWGWGWCSAYYMASVCLVVVQLGVHRRGGCAPVFSYSVVARHADQQSFQLQQQRQRQQQLHKFPIFMTDSVRNGRGTCEMPTI